MTTCKHRVVKSIEKIRFVEITGGYLMAIGNRRAYIILFGDRPNTIKNFTIIVCRVLLVDVYF